MDDPYDLERFVAAQDAGGPGGSVFDTALAELRRGRKTSHWIWFVFPQIAGLGQSPTSRRYAISSLAEAQAYLRHPVLGPRLAEAARGLIEQPRTDAAHIRASRARVAQPGSEAHQIFGGREAEKLGSSMNLFNRADPDSRVYGRVLTQYF